MKLILALARQAMKSRTQAVGFGVIFGLLPLCGWVSSVLSSFITLQKGPWEGVFVLLLGPMLSTWILSHLSVESIWIYSLIGSYVLSYGLSTLLYYTSRWSVLLDCSLVFGILFVVGTHFHTFELHSVWMQMVNPIFLVLNQKLRLNWQGSNFYSFFWTNQAAALYIGLIFLNALWNVWIARWAHRKFNHLSHVNDNLLKRPLHPLSHLLVLSMISLSFFENEIAVDSLPVVWLIESLAGLPVLSFIIKKSNLPRYAIFILYSGLLLFSYYSVWFLVALACANSLLNLRKDRWLYLSKNI